MPNKRYHPPVRFTDHPMVQEAFKTIGAMLIATKGKDLEADFAMCDEDGLLHQYHIEITDVTYT